MGSPRCHGGLLPAVAVWLAMQSTVLAAFTNNFDKYPTGSQSCLTDAANASNCNGDDVESMNLCLCSNGGNFVIAAATCIGQSDPGDVETVYSTMASACSYTNTSLTISQKEFVDAANGALSSSTAGSTKSKTTTPPPSSTSPSSSQTPSLTTITTVESGHTVTLTSTAGGAKNTGGNSSNDNTNSSGMSSTAKVGIIAGACVAGVAIIAAAAFLIMRYRRNRPSGEENRPMLGHDKFVGGGGGGGGGGVGSFDGRSIGDGSGTELSHLSSGNAYDWKAGGPEGTTVDAKWHQPDGGSQDPYFSGWSTGGEQQQQHGGVFELPAQVQPYRPVEMPATPLGSTVDTAYRPHGPHNPQAWGSSEYR